MSWSARRRRRLPRRYSSRGFLARIVEEAPGGRLDPLPSEWDLPCGGSDTYRVSYLGRTQPKYRDVVLPRGRWAVDVIDTWAMTVDHLDGVFERVCRVPLPGREYMAIRLRAGLTVI